MEPPSTEIEIRIRKPSERGICPVDVLLSDHSTYAGVARLTGEWLQECLLYEYDLDRYGEHLFTALFAGDVGIAYAVATGQARARTGGRVRIRLMLDDEVPPEIQALKWERLKKPEGERLAASNLTPFSRDTPLGQGYAEPFTDNRIEMLYVVAAPSDAAGFGLAKINAEAEVTQLFQALAGVWRSGRCHATVMPGRTELSPETQQLLRDAGCDIVSGNATLDNIASHLEGKRVLHFLGHGWYRDGKGWLGLERDDGTLDRTVDEDVIAGRLINNDVGLVFLAACESARRGAGPAGGGKRSEFRGLAGALVRKGVPAVVAMQEQLALDAAYPLAREFYRRLFLHHGFVDRALNEARAALFTQQDPDWATPVLYMRLRTGQLATSNPVWAALQTLRDHPDYADFRSEKYLPLPLSAQVVPLVGARFIAEAQQESGSFELLGAILNQLGGGQAVCRDNATAGPLVLVLGGPGTSKSTQLKRLGWETIRAPLASPASLPILPVYLGLQEFRASAQALEKLVIARLREFLPGPDLGSFKDLASEMEQVRLRVLVNAGDLLPDAAHDVLQQAAGLARDFPVHEYVVAMQPTSLRWEQPAGDDAVTPCVLVIQPLTTREIRYFLDGRGEPGERLLDKLYDTSLFDLASTPYFLWRMYLKSKSQSLPASRATLIRELMDAAIAEIPAQKGMRAGAPHFLRRLALEMQETEQPIWSVDRVFGLMADARGGRGYDIEELYDELVQGEVLLAVGEGSVRFAYPSLQAYFCAQAILALPARERTLTRIVESLGSPIRTQWWEEALVIASGLLAVDGSQPALRTLQHLLEPLAYGSNLLEGATVFLAARCLLDSKPVFEAQDLQALVDHVTNALERRTNSALEPELARRLQATQLLAQLAMPQTAVCLARNTYQKVRRNTSNRQDFEFSSIRFAAAIALKRMPPEQAKEALAKINPKLVKLFLAWRAKDVDEVIRQSQVAGDPGLQGLAALALGDLHGATAGENPPLASGRALNRLISMFLSGDTLQGVRWAVADALSLLDIVLVNEALTEPLLRRLRTPETTPLPEQAKIRKTFAYLLGLLRQPNDDVRNFLVQECLGQEGCEGSRDWSTWSTAISALGRIGSKHDAGLLAEIAAGRLNGGKLEDILKDPVKRSYVRREAINALATLGDFTPLSASDIECLANDPYLSRAYYKARHDLYWREAAALRTEG